ncbi:UvrD-helicase domain-containing protein [Nocardia jinanensis]|uniref:RecBCD enzyme subunit RecB n=1 Tax=Nocardia jinanensis TaxID=382504 RepID=A0A917RD23_9NOCA|nr:UvrD-helicase domain-containing protein [Nocardia jinanensis]GGL01382.1 RecBCD enzyme subunit RecB [Nocardia jinanensis]
MTTTTATTTTDVPGNAFELCGSLPQGTTVLEASAGTGKTYAIVGLAVRYVAETGVDISRLLLVTFSRAATQELRERTRDRFVTVAAALADPVAARTASDELIRHLADADPEEVRARRTRLRAALSDFDAGVIATTHSFCQRMLAELGLAGDHDPGARLVEEADDLIRTVVDDLYLSRYARTRAPFSVKQAHRFALAAVRDRQARLAPDTDDASAQRIAFAAAVRAETERRKRLAGLRDFDDLLVLLRDILADPARGPAACRRIRDRYRVVLVDEFQDTDPLQWEILRRAFHGHNPLVLVGDPKQAIYAFRGAEVLSYLDAVGHATARRELTTNRRSDAGLLAALEHLLGGAALGHDEIVVPAVTPTQPWTRLRGPAELITPLRLRCLPRTGAGPRGASGFPNIHRQRARVAADLAADIVALLESGTVLADSPRTRPGAQAPVTTPAGERPVGPGDIAVLVRTHTQLEVVRSALERAGVPVVLASGSSIFATRSATDWLWVLRALEQPHRADRVRLAALTPLFGHTGADLDSGGADLVGRVSAELRDAARLFARAGFAAVFDELATGTRLAPRLLAVEHGERRLTDLRHIAQLLDEVSATEGLGLTALTRWLADRVREPASGSVPGRSRRLDRDIAAVQIATVHASKGLEFPVVYLPFAWDSSADPKPATLLMHDDDARVLDIGGPDAPGYTARKERADSESAGEELRLCYVALTRACCQVVAWWAPSFGTATAPLHRLLFGRAPDAARPSARAAVPEDGAVVDRLRARSAGAGESISVTAADPAADPPVYRPWTDSGSGAMAVATFDREIDEFWRRTSYSALTATAHAVVPESEPEDAPGPGDEPEVPVPLAEPGPGPGVSSLMNDLPYGAEFGTLVHGVLERVDTDAPDLVAEVRARCAESIGEMLSAADPELLTTALVEVLRTPIGFGALADIPGRDRLCELEFELPLAGGDTPAGEAATLRGIAATVRAHLAPDDDFHAYADELDTLDDIPLRGYLTGSIDAVLRTPDQRCVVVDYKTNRLGTGDLTVAHYTRERMAAEMFRSHYPLQALLYSVALHRYLRWRLPGYDPAVHLGGIRYLFVRGMVGPGTPAGAGVFDWTPPPGLIIALSDLLAGGVS